MLVCFYPLLMKSSSSLFLRVLNVLSALQLLLGEGAVRVLSVPFDHWPRGFTVPPLQLDSPLIVIVF